MPEPRESLRPYSYAYYPAARQERQQFPRELLPHLLRILDELELDPENPVLPLERKGKGQKGQLVVYRNPSPPIEVTYEIDAEARTVYWVHFAAPLVQLKMVFVSYSHKNSDWLERVKPFLVPLEDKGLISLWVDSDIEPGAQWLEKIRKALQSANIAVLLVTQDFLISPFIKTVELKELLLKAAKSNLKVIPIVVSFATFEDSEIGDLQAANDPKKPLDSLPAADQNRVLVEIYNKVKQIALAN